MTAKRVNLFVLVVVILTIFTGQKLNAKEYESPVYTQYVAEVTSTFLKEVYEEYGFRCGASGGSMPYDVEEISVSLHANQCATVEQARELEVRLTERFVQIINSHEKIRPFLREYPFPSSRADVAISFRRNKKAPYTDDDVSFVFQAKNKIFYQSDNPDKLYDYRNIKEEPYEEALKIVQNNAAKKASQKSTKL